MKYLVLVLWLVLCANAQPAGYTSSAVITVDHTKVPNTDQLNFPLLIVGASTALKARTYGGQMCNANGYDILFTSDAKGANPLPYERELHNTVAGRIAYWVKIPVLSHTTDTPVYIWYGNAHLMADQSSRASVWDANYKAVWHLDDNAANTTVADSTSHQHNGVNRTNTNTRAVAGPIPNVTALAYNGVDYTTIASPAGGDFDFTTGNFSFDFWLKVNQYVVYSAYFGNGVWDNTGYYFQEASGGHGLSFASNYSGAYSPYTNPTSRPSGVWMHVAVIRNGSTLSIYVNGALASTLSNFHQPASSSNPFTIGGTAGGSTGNGLMNGDIQEFRVSNINRSSDWVATEYANQNSPGTFFSQLPSGWSTSSALPPSCNAGTSQVFLSGQPANLDGSASFPQDGSSTLTYSWQQVPSQAAGVPMHNALLSSNSVARPSLTQLAFGPLDFQLTVTQSNGQSSSCTVNDGAVTTQSNGAVQVSTGNPTLDGAVNNLLGPMVPLGRNPWPFYDTASQNDAAAQIANMDTLYGAFWNTAGPGTISVAANSYNIVGNGTSFTTTFCQGPANPTVPIPGAGLVVWYPLNDGTGRFGRRLAGYPWGPGDAYIKSCTDNTHMTLTANNPWFPSEASCPTGQAAPCWLQYSLWAVPAGNEWDDIAAPANYYDAVSAYYALYFRSGLEVYLINARKLADRYWSSPTFDLGNAFDPNYPLFGFAPQFRCWSIQGMVLRALDNSDGHPDMWAGLHKAWNKMFTTYWLGGYPTPNTWGLDPRESGYGLAQLADCALYDTSPQYQQTCRNYIQESFETTGTGALNIWPSRQGADGGWEQLYAAKGSWTNNSTVSLTLGSKLVTCTTSNCNWAASDFPAAPQSYVWFTQSSARPTSNSQGDPDAYCYQPGSSATCTFIDSSHFMLDRPYDGANCAAGCARGWVFGIDVAGWGEEPFFEGILAFAFDLAGRAMACTSTNVPAGCDNPTSALAFQSSASAANWIKQYGINTTADGYLYFAIAPGCQEPVSPSNYWCTMGGGMAAREYAGDGFRGMMVYYLHSHDASMKLLLDQIYAGLWAKPGTSPIVPSPDGTYDSNFDTNGWWLTSGAVQSKLFGQMFGFGALYSWPAVRIE